MAVVGSAYVVIRAITSGFSKDVDKAFSNFAKDALKARERFQSMVRTGYTLAPLISVLVSSLGSLVGGLLSLGATALAAVPQLVTLGGVFTSLGLAALVTASAFSGVGKAISAGLKKSSTGAKQDASSKIAAARRIEAAKEALADADERLTESQENLTKALKDGREELQQLGFDAEDAAINEKKASIELEKARETLARVQDLPPNSRARREAQLAFAEAELNYRKSKDRNKDLQQQQKDLVDKSKNVSKKLLDVAKATFPDVQDEGLLRLISATDTAQDAFKNVQQAEKAKARAERDALRAQEEATDGAGTGGAVDPFAEALKDLSPATQSFVKFIVGEFIPALKKLRDAAAEGLFPELEKGLKRLKDELFPDLEQSFFNLGQSVGKAFNSIVDAMVDIENKADLKKVFDQAGYVVEGFGRIFGNVYDSILSLLVGADPQIRRFVDFLEKKTKDFAEYLDIKQASGELEEFFNKTGDITARIGGILGNTVSGIVNVVKAAFEPGGGGYLILDWLEDVTQGFEDFFATTEGKDWLRDSTEQAIKVLSSIGAFIKEILKAGADPNVGKFWDILKSAAPIFGDILREANAAAPALANFFVSIMKFTKLTLENGAITMFFTVLRVSLDAINKLLSNEIVAGILKVTGTIFAFLSALGLIISVAKFAFLVLGGNVLNVIVIFGRLLGITRLATLTMTGLTTAIKTLAKTIISKLLVGLRALGTFFLTNPVGLFITVLAGLVVLFVTLYTKNETFRKAVQDAFAKVTEAATKAFNWIKDNWPLILAILTGPIGLFVLAVVKNWDKIVDFTKGLLASLAQFGSTIWNWITESLSAVWEGTKAIFVNIVDFTKGLPAKLAQFGSTIWNWITERLSAMWEGAKIIFGNIVEWVKGVPGKLRDGVANMWTWVTDKLSSTFDGLKTKWSEILNWVTGLPGRVRNAVGDLWGGIRDSFRAALNWIINKWNSFRIEARVPDNSFTSLLGIAGKGFTLDTPNIPTLALGGVVQPSAAGTVVRVAEAGRPERIEPLDEQGLSRRDRAIVAQLAGAGAGTSNIINVYPSPGMDENELAAMIDRALAFRLRRGGA